MSTTQTGLSTTTRERDTDKADSGDSADTETSRCEAVNPATGKRCANTASQDGLCALCRHAVTVVRTSQVSFDPIENPTPFSELDTSPGGDQA